MDVNKSNGVAAFQLPTELVFPEKLLSKVADLLSRLQLSNSVWPLDDFPTESPTEK